MALPQSYRWGVFYKSSMSAHPAIRPKRVIRKESAQGLKKLRQAGLR